MSNNISSVIARSNLEKSDIDSKPSLSLDKEALKSVDSHQVNINKVNSKVYVLKEAYCCRLKLIEAKIFRKKSNLDKRENFS